MIMVTGKYGSGKKKFLKERFGLDDEFEGVFFVTEYIEKEYGGQNEEHLKKSVCEKIRSGEYKIVACEERGCRILPMFQGHRRLVELNGEIACDIARIAREVFLIENGEKLQIK